MTRPTRPLTLLALAAAALSPAAWAAQTLNVTLGTPMAVLQGDTPVQVTVSVTNTGTRTAKLLRWQLPEGRLQGPLFQVTRADGSVAPYLGPLIKRGAPQAGDYVRLAPGATLSYTVDLASRYQLGDGQYTVRYLGAARHSGQADLVSTEALQLWTSGRSAAEAKAASVPEPSVLASGLTFNACSASQQSQLTTAVADATRYARGAASYLRPLTGATPRYTTWFGTYAEANRRQVHTNFKKMVGAFTTQPLHMDCSCTDGYYAYVYPSDPYKVYLCAAFWSAPRKGTDSKAGTLVHEMSHFTVVADTDDWAYGQSAAKALAISNPQRAIANADSHEYFAENTPAQP